MLTGRKTGNPPRFKIEEIWIDTPEIGLTMHPDIVLRRAYPGLLDQDIKTPKETTIRLS